MFVQILVSFMDKQLFSFYKDKNDVCSTARIEPLLTPKGHTLYHFEVCSHSLHECVFCYLVIFLAGTVQDDRRKAVLTVLK